MPLLVEGETLIVISFQIGFEMEETTLLEILANFEQMDSIKMTHQTQEIE